MNRTKSKRREREQSPLINAEEAPNMWFEGSRASVSNVK